MAKTNPIGVRFDEDLLSELKEQGRAESPQKALNYLSDFYRKNGKDKDWLKSFVKEAHAKSVTVVVSEKHSGETRHKLWKENDPAEGTMKFYLKYDCNNYDELENKTKV